MKKSIALLLATSLALTPLTLSMTACEKTSAPAAQTTGTEVEAVPTTPRELYQYATRKLAEADNYRVNYRYSVMLSGVNEPFALDAVVQTVNESRDGDNVICKMYQNNLLVELSHIDGVMYMVQDDTQAKATMTQDEFVRYFGYERPDVLEQMPESAYAKLRTSQSGENQVLKFNLTEADMRSIAGNLRDCLQLGADSDNAKFESGTYVVYINPEGQAYKSELEMKFRVTYKYKECIGFVVAASSIAYGVAKVKAPSDAGSYVDITGQLVIPK